MGCKLGDTWSEENYLQGSLAWAGWEILVLLPDPYQRITAMTDPSRNPTKPVSHDALIIHTTWLINPIPKQIFLSVGSSKVIPVHNMKSTEDLYVEVWRHPKAVNHL